MTGKDEALVATAGERPEHERFRTTVYLTEAEMTALDELKSHFRRQEKRKIDQSQLIREAIQHYRAALLACQ